MNILMHASAELATATIWFEAVGTPRIAPREAWQVNMIAAMIADHVPQLAAKAGSTLRSLHHCFEIGCACPGVPAWRRPLQQGQGHAVHQGFCWRCCFVCGLEQVRVLCLKLLDARRVVHRACDWQRHRPHIILQVLNMTQQLVHIQWHVSVQCHHNAMTECFFGRFAAQAQSDEHAGHVQHLRCLRHSHVVEARPIGAGVVVFQTHFSLEGR